MCRKFTFMLESVPSWWESRRIGCGRCCCFFVTDHKRKLPSTNQKLLRDQINDDRVMVGSDPGSPVATGGLVGLGPQIEAW